jgi:hypothetical protein
LYDSLGQIDPQAYNAIHWDGIKWNMFKFQFFTFCNQIHTGSYPARSVFVLNPDDIIISCGSQVTWIKNNIQIRTECIPLSVRKIWGNEKNNLYAVGDQA